MRFAVPGTPSRTKVRGSNMHPTITEMIIMRTSLPSFCFALAIHPLLKNKMNIKRRPKKLVMNTDDKLIPVTWLIQVIKLFPQHLYPIKL